MAIANRSNDEALCFRREKLGSNSVTEKAATPFWRFCVDELGEEMLRVLIGAAIISMVVGAIDEGLKGAGEGMAIMVAVAENGGARWRTE